MKEKEEIGGTWFHLFLLYLGKGRMMTERKEKYRRSANGEGQIVSFSWRVREPKAIVQLVHDMSDHSGRLKALASALNEAGYDVCANDMAGHGMSKQGHRGAFAMKKGALDDLLEDMDTLFQEETEQRETLPRILIGVGFGALLSVLYAARYRKADMLVAVAIPAIPKALAGMKLSADLHIRRYGYHSVSDGVHNMMYPLSKQPGSDPSNRFFWLSTEEEEVRRYAADENCGFPLTASGYREVIRAFKEVKGKEGISALPDLPVYFLSGGEDQLGECGRAVNFYTGKLAKSGHEHVAYKLYKGCYHDLLHDRCRHQLLDDVVTWIDLNMRSR